MLCQFRLLVPERHFFFSFDTNNKMHCNYITKPLESIFNGDSKQDFLQTKFVESFCRYILAIDDTFCLILLHLNEVEPHFGPLPSFSPSIHPSNLYARFLLHSGVKAHRQQLQIWTHECQSFTSLDIQTWHRKMLRLSMSEKI